MINNNNDLTDYIHVFCTGMINITAITSYEEYGKDTIIETTCFLSIDDLNDFRQKHPFKVKKTISICNCNPDLLKEFDYYEVEYENDNNSISTLICDSHGKLRNWKGGNQ